MTATASSYRVIVSPSPWSTGHLEYELARASTQGDVMRGHPEFGHLAERAGAERPVWDPLESLTSPVCTEAQARELALAWLRLTQPGPIPSGAVEFRFLEPDAPSTAVTGSVSYGRIPWGRRWRRLKTHTGG